MLRRVWVMAVGMVFSLALGATAWAGDLEMKGSVPSMGADGDLVAVVAGEEGNLGCAVSHDGGANFGAAVAVGKVASGQMLGMRRGPQIAVRGKTIMIVTNTAKAARIAAFRSVDEGKTWQGPTDIDEPSGRSPEGLMSVAPTREGFAVVYLELVDKMMRISMVRSVDDGKTWEKSRLVYASPDGHVCECCQPTIVSDRGGNVAVMFRNTLAGNRDMYVTLSKDDGKTFGAASKLGKGTWPLDACPMDGGGITLEGKEGGKEKGIVAAFRRQGTLYTVRPGEAEREIGTGKNPVIVATEAGLVLAWETKTGMMIRVPKAKDVAMEGAGAPELVKTSRGIVLAYTTREGNASVAHTRVVGK